MIKRGKDIITIFCNSLLKRDHLFVLWVQRLIQQTLQFIFQVRSELIWIVIEGRRKLDFKFMRFFEHSPESDAPNEPCKADCFAMSNASLHCPKRMVIV